MDKKLGVPLKCMAIFARWHERLIHISHEKLRKIVQLGAKGMDISGNTPSRSSCNCQTCRLARAKSKPQKREQHSEINRPGQRVSTDLKSLPHECLENDVPVVFHKPNPSLPSSANHAAVLTCIGGCENHSRESLSTFVGPIWELL